MAQLEFSKQVCLWFSHDLPYLLTATSFQMNAVSLEVHELFLCLNMFVSFCFSLKNVYLNVFVFCLFSEITLFHYVKITKYLV